MAIDWKKVAKYGAEAAYAISNPLGYAPRKAGQVTAKAITSKTNKKQSTTPETNTPALQEYKTTASKSTGSGSSSYSSSIKPYLNAMLDAYQQGADANKAAAKMTYDTTLRNLKTSLDRAQASYDTGVANANQAYENTRSNLLTSLKRFQEENAKNVENQKRAYLTDQAALESARLEADRQTRINNAARGLGGSGLQQLAQLQNLINQGQEISDLAASNQSEMDALRTQMTQAQEDYKTGLANAEKARENTVDNLLTVLNNAKADKTTGEADALATYNAALQGIEANLANQIADAKYNFGQNSYSASRSGGSSDNEASVVAGLYLAAEENLANQLDYIDSLSSSDIKKLKDANGKRLYNTTDKSKIKQQIYTDAKNSLTDYLSSYGSNYKKYYDIGVNNLKSIYQSR